MCKLAYVRTTDGSAYNKCIRMIEHQEWKVGGHSTGFSFKTSSGFSTRKAIGKVNSYLEKFPDNVLSDECLGHTRWATVGVINLDNQHPISIMYKDKKIGYGVHNGSLIDWEAYEHYRRPGVINKTDSAVIFGMFSEILERLGDNKKNRRIAFSVVLNLIKSENNHNLIIMFKDGQVLFGGNALTYSVVPNEKVGIMTFGFKNEVEDGYVYEIENISVNRYLIKPPENLKLFKKFHKKKFITQ